MVIAIASELKSEKIFTNLTSKIDYLNENISQIDLNSKQILTQINHIEESQEITKWPNQSQEIVRHFDRIAIALEQMALRPDQSQEIVERLDRIERYLVTNIPPSPPGEE